MTLRPLTGSRDDYEPLVKRARAARFVLLGEASHGTREFYSERAEITKRLVAEAGYTAVAVEADWPDAYRVNRFVRGESDDLDAEEALRGFRRFPAWMWRNREVLDFVTWLRDWNASLPGDAPKVGFYGLDLYSLHASIDAVVAFLEDVDLEAAERARERYACFDHFGPDSQVYAYETGLGGAETCEQQAVEQVIELLGSRPGSDDGFYAEQNARVVANAERYYRTSFRGGVSSWNLRDTHMVETLEALVAHLDATAGGGTKAAVWAHNSHLGDARATEMSSRGELNVGQLVRERHGERALLVGFTTYAGTVTAASDWGATAERMRVRPALPNSWEQLFHERGVPRFLLEPHDLEPLHLERAIGVVYRPETERRSHYFEAQLGAQFDVAIHIDETSAVEPLEPTSEWEAGELPETYPFAV